MNVPRQHVVKRGDVVESFISSCDTVLINPDGHGECKCFVVHAVIGTCSERVWAVCSELKKVGTNCIYKVGSASTSSLKLLALSNSVRRVYNCNHRTPNESAESSYNSHSNDMDTLLCGDSAFLLRRRDGYPPRQA